MEKKIFEKIIELKDSIESKDINIFYNSLENFKIFFIENKTDLYNYLNKLEDEKEFYYTKDSFRKFFNI
jgi:hypothetical protein